MNSLFSVKEKVILLTGGYGILGACMAKHLAREGAYVVILGRNEQKGSALVNDSGPYCRQWSSPRSWWDKGKEALLTSRPNHPYAH